jgi:hypothetical protein
MLFCVDPISCLPIKIDYAEYFPAGSTPSPSFADEAAAFFNSIEFYRRTNIEVTAAIVQANTKLFSDADAKDYPAQVVLSLGPNITSVMLKKLGPNLFALKKTSSKDPDKQVIARDISDKRFRPLKFLQVPRSLSGSDKVYMGGAVIRRNLFPKGHIGKKSGYGEFLLKLCLQMIGDQLYLLEHIGVEWLR